MDKRRKRLKKCSTSTDVEDAHHINNITKEEKKRKKSTAHDVNKPTEHSQKMKKVGASKKMAAHDVTIHGLASTIENDHDEIKKLTDTFKEMTETMKNLQESLLTKTDLPEIKNFTDSFKEMTQTMRELQESLLTNAADLPEKDTPKPKVKHECLVATLASHIINERTIYVEGFKTSVPKDDIKNALIKHFESCGEVAWVIVFYECGEDETEGYALIEMKNDHSKALTLNGSRLGRKKLEVMMATKKPSLFMPAIGECSVCNDKRINRMRRDNFHKWTFPFREWEASPV